MRCRNRECPGHALSFRAEDFQAAIILYKIFGLDVILRIGTLRYEEHKTYAEIKEALRKKNIKISMGELTNLTVTFESLIKGWHEEHILEIREKLGEYVLSIDATYTYKGKHSIFSAVTNLGVLCMRIPQRKMTYSIFSHCWRRSLKCTAYQSWS